MIASHPFFTRTTKREVMTGSGVISNPENPSFPGLFFICHEGPSSSIFIPTRSTNMKSIHLFSSLLKSEFDTRKRNNYVDKLFSGSEAVKCEHEPGEDPQLPNSISAGEAKQRYTALHSHAVEDVTEKTKWHLYSERGEKRDLWPKVRSDSEKCRDSGNYHAVLWWGTEMGNMTADDLGCENKLSLSSSLTEIRLKRRDKACYIWKVPVSWNQQSPFPEA